MLSKLRRRLRAADPIAVLALIVAIAFAGAPALAEPIANTSAGLGAQLKRALRIGKVANKRSVIANKRSVNAIRRGAQPGPQGPRGPQGPAGPSTGAAGGDLTGDYPDPRLAAGSVGADELADDSVDTDALQDGSIEGLKLAQESVAGYHVLNNSLTDSDIAEFTIPGLPHAWGNVSDSPGSDPTLPTGNRVSAVNDGPSDTPGIFCFEIPDAWAPQLILATPDLSGPTVNLKQEIGTALGCEPTDDAVVYALDDEGNLVDGADFSVVFISF